MPDGLSAGSLQRQLQTDNPIWATVGSMTSQLPEILVIGAGVSGLTTAICLAEAGCGVTVAAARRAPMITSAAAGAIWGPHLVGIDERVTRWGDVTLARLADLAAGPARGGPPGRGLRAE